MRFQSRSNIKPNLRMVRDEAAKEAEILLYDVIDPFWGIGAKDVKEQLKALTDVDTIHLRINSPGGSVFEGMTIANAFRDHKARVITHVDGVAASIASVIALAADEVRISDNAFFMIHDPWTFAMGNAEELRGTADLLDKVGGAIVAQYVKESGKPEAEVRDLMAKETWFTAQEAVDAGFADVIEGLAEESPSPADLFDFSAFKCAPAALSTSARGSRAEKPTLRELEHIMRDAGYSRSEAGRAASAAIRSLAQRDAGADEFVSSASQLLSTINNSR